MSAGTAAAAQIVLVVSEEQVRERLVGEVKHRFGGDYQVVGAPSGRDAIALLAASGSGREVAAVIAAQRLSDMSGVALLGQVSGLAPGAKRGLIVTYGDPEANDRIIEGTTFGQIDQWCWAPWEPAEELLFPFVSALVTAWARARDVPRFEAVRVVGAVVGAVARVARPAAAQRHSLWLLHRGF